MASNAGSLRIYLFGATQGESIAIQLPNGKWGVVDCFASSLTSPATNPVHALLKASRVEEIEFLCLTHPHVDHFNGMSHLLRDFSVKQFWTFCGLDPTDFRLLCTYFQAEAEQAARSALKLSAAELASIFDLVLESGIQRQVVVSRRDIYPVPSDDDVRIEIRGIAPTDERAQSYKQSMLTSLVKKRGTVQALPNAAHNTISIALRIRYGKSTVLLGGDVEEEGWKTVLREHRPQELESHFVKISHHGSTTGYCNGLWSVLSAQGTNQTSLVAARPPYKRFQACRATDRLSTTSRIIQVRSTPPSQRGHSPSVQNWRLVALAKLRSASSGRFPDATADASPGCCEIEVSDQGECRVILHPPACELFVAAPA